MFCASGLIESIESTFHRMERLNFTPFRIPYTVKKTSKKGLRFESCKKYKSSNWIWQSILILVVLGFTTYKLLKEATSNVEKAVRILHIISFPAVLINVYKHRQKSDTFVSFLNGLLSFETTYLEGKSPAEESNFWRAQPAASFAKKSILAFQMSLLPLPFLVAICDTFLMKSPWFLLPQPLLENWIFQLGEVIGRVIIFLFTYTFWRVFFYAWLILGSFSCVPSYCGLSLVNLALGRELHRLQTSNDADRYVGKNREAKLLCSLYNEVHQHRITPSTIVTAVAALSVFLYTLVAEWSRMGLVEVVICLNDISVGVLVIVSCLGLAAEVFATGQRVTYSPRHNNTIVQTKLKKYWKSFPTLKIGFGQDNYVDSATPLVVFDFAIDVTVNLILLK